MSLIKKYICLIVGLSFSITLIGQVANPIGSQCNLCKSDSKHIHLDPYQVNLKKEVPFFLTGLGLLSSGLYIKSINEKPQFTVEELNALDANKINSFDRRAVNYHSNADQTASNVILYTGLALPTLFFMSNHHTRKDVGPLLIMSLEILTISNGLSFNAKYIFNRSRPQAYNSAFSINERTSSTARLSFFSGHTTQTAAFSIFITKVISDYHPNMKNGVKIGLYTFGLGLPATMGYLRVKSGKHFPTDVKRVLLLEH
ncbi:MAG: phosphatase PAP2 family protein [Flavobacteriales bacterium]|nr:phosphatase PAP2 family protein [Flavobacteriales bacterium]